MQAFKVEYPDTVPWLRAQLEGGLETSTKAYASDVWVASKLPDPLQDRMVILSNNSGPDAGPQKIERYGVNVWASGYDAQGLAALCSAVLRRSADGKPVTRVQVTGGPYDISDEDDALTSVGGKVLNHFFFTLELTVRGVNF
jgi:hypothetical protein